MLGILLEEMRTEMVVKNVKFLMRLTIKSYELSDRHYTKAHNTHNFSLDFYC